MAAISKRLRLKIESAIEHLVALLDHVDGDADLEPSLGWVAGTTLRGELWGNADDREGHDDDREPSLGSPELQVPLAWPGMPIGFSGIDTGCSQANWARGGDDDREADPLDDGEENHRRAPAEPVVGSFKPVAFFDGRVVMMGTVPGAAR